MKSLQVIGPYFTNYSYAKVNRGLAFALNEIQDEYKVNLWCDPMAIDRLPSEKELQENTKLDKLVLRSKIQTDIAIYNNFPKSIEFPHGLKDLPAKVKIGYLAWEETVYPEHWVKEINENLHGLMCISSFVTDIIKKAGVKIPIQTVKIGLDESQMIPSKGTYPIKSTKSFKFLHISTARKRKGVDVLIKAYFKAFTKDDDVTLVIKSFPGPDNMVDSLLKEFGTEDSPEVIHINNPDLTEAELRELTASADCAVYPTRAEGFGLPIAEAMYHGVPVITTNYSGQLDFIDEASGFMIDYKLEYATGSEMVNIGARWAEPSLVDLTHKMREVYELQKSKNDEDKKKLENIITNAKTNVEKLTWTRTAEEALEFIKKVESIAENKTEKFAVISPINSEDGVAEYTKGLFSNFESSFKEFYYISNKDIADRVTNDGKNVVRTWEMGTSDMSETVKFINDKKITNVYIQYHSGSYYPPQILNKFIKDLKDLGIKVVVDLHSVKSETFDHTNTVSNLEIADWLIIHNKPNFEYVSSKFKNAKLIPLASQKVKKRSSEKVKEILRLKENYPIVSTHGLLNQNKNVLEIIKVIKDLKSEYPNIMFLGLNAVSSNNSLAAGLHEEIKNYIDKNKLQNNVRFFSNFLDRNVIQLVLQASDVIVLAYREVGESASDAVRTCMATLRPVVVTDINMFNEFNSEVFKISTSKPEDIKNGILNVLENEEGRRQKIESAKIYIERNSFVNVGVETLQLINKV